MENRICSLSYGGNYAPYDAYVLGIEERTSEQGPGGNPGLDECTISEYKWVARSGEGNTSL